MPFGRRFSNICRFVSGITRLPLSLIACSKEFQAITAPLVNRVSPSDVSYTSDAAKKKQGVGVHILCVVKPFARGLSDAARLARISRSGSPQQAPADIQEKQRHYSATLKSSPPREVRTRRVPR
jgi:hypothetical protein